ncbi:hypothetical protein RND81_11G098500 [Saponaria officinalis]|uniref:glycerophosphodiester phosphodiesterase n=1 Tax=Saponaria officinalis TaxID=3572 RepID=A0AAW1HK89_SAPOF
MMTSVPDLVLWCNAQLTKDGFRICVPSIMLNNGTDVAIIYPDPNSYVVDGVKKDGYFSIDFTLEQLGLVSLTHGLYSRPEKCL